MKDALAFLSRRNVLELPQSNWSFLLMDFAEKKGEKALEALAGFYLYAVKNIDGEDRQTNALKETFLHDLSGRDDKIMEPRSSSYRQFWISEK